MHIILMKTSTTLKMSIGKIASLMNKRPKKTVNSGDVAVIITVSANGKCFKVKKFSIITQEEFAKLEKNLKLPVEHSNES